LRMLRVSRSDMVKTKTKTHAKINTDTHPKSLNFSDKQLRHSVHDLRSSAYQKRRNIFRNWRLPAMNSDETIAPNT
jgi:hypothetical protein